MRMDKFSYAEAEACLYEGMRWKKNKDGEIEAEREGKACIDVTKTHMNFYYTKDCLRPDIRFLDKKYAKEHRGESIAAYHNSQTSSQSRAVMNGNKLSQAEGVIMTLPRDNPWVQKANLTDEEFEYMRDKMVEIPHDTSIHLKRDVEMENRIKEKLKKVVTTPEDREQVNAFLIATFTAWLRKCGIRNEDVLFYAIHWDETFPHLHGMILPTVEKKYEEDVYSKRKKNDGTYTLLHAKGSTSISYSVERFYANAYVDEANKVHYPFMEEYHPHIISMLQNTTIEEMDVPMSKEEWKAIFKKYPELTSQIKETSGGLLNGKTKGKGFLPKNLSKDQREESVVNAEINRLIEQSTKENLKDFDKKLEEMQEKLGKVCRERDEAISQKDTAIAEAQASREEVREALAEARALEEEKDEILGELASKEITLVEQIKKHQNFVEKFKKFLETLTEKAIKYVVNKFVPVWKNAKEKVEQERIDEEAKTTLVEVVTKEIETFKEQVEINPLEGVGATSFDRTNRTQINAALSQIKKALVGTIFEDDVKFVTPQAVEMHPLMKHCFDIWFDEERETKLLASVPVEERSFFMRPTNRAERFKEIFMEEIETGKLDNIYDEEEEGLER